MFHDRKGVVPAARYLHSTAQHDAAGHQFWEVLEHGPVGTWRALVHVRTSVLSEVYSKYRIIVGLLHQCA